MKLIATMTLRGELNKKDEAVERLRKKIGLKPGKLLTNSSGEAADILAVDEDAGTVTLGVLSKRDPITVPISTIVRRPPS